MNQPAIVSRLRVHPGRRADAVDVLRPAVDATRDEAGTLSCRMMLDRDDPDVIWFFDEFRDDAAVAAHRRNVATSGVGRRLASLLDGLPQEHVVDLVAAQLSEP